VPHQLFNRRPLVSGKSQPIIVQNVTQHWEIRGRNNPTTTHNAPQYMNGIIVQVTLATNIEFTWLFNMQWWNTIPLRMHPLMYLSFVQMVGKYNTWCSMSTIEERFEGGDWVICNIWWVPRLYWMICNSFVHELTWTLVNCC